MQDQSFLSIMYKSICKCRLEALSQDTYRQILTLVFSDEVLKIEIVCVHWYGISHWLCVKEIAHTVLHSSIRFFMPGCIYVYAEMS